MGINKITRQLAAWIACFAILLAGLAPSIFQTVSATSNSPISLMEICSAAGTKFIKVTSGFPSAPSSPIKKNVHSGHCAFCSTDTGSFGLLPATTFIFPLVNGVNLFPSLFYQSPRPLFMWTMAQSRAPPFAS